MNCVPASESPLPRVPPSTGRGSDSCVHTVQYDEKVASFFNLFNQLTGRSELYYGYLVGSLRAQGNRNKGTQIKKEAIAVDFGCGTGWLTQRLPQLGFNRVFGIDTSPSMLAEAFHRTSRNLTTSGALCYRHQVPQEIIGKCDLVTAVHVHYHFEPYKKLKDNFFGTISSLLAPHGEAILVGCPSDYIHATPDHYQNSVHINDVPESVLDNASSPVCLTDKDGYIPLSCLPRFSLKDGIQMKVTFTATEPNGTKQASSLVDTYWSDNVLIKAAQSQGLELIAKQNLNCGGYENAYMMMHFRKTGVTPPPAP